MPVFEDDEPISAEEMRRQQHQLDLKIFRREMREAFDCVQQDKFEGGDNWEEEDVKN